MSVAKVIEITARSPESLEAAIEHGIERASETVDHIQSAWVKEVHAEVDGGAVSGYRVHLMVTFLLDD